MIAMPCCVLQLAQQVEDLRLGRHVERGRRLVGDQQARIAGERHRDHRPLAQAADSWKGYSSMRCSGRGMPTVRSSSIAARRAPRACATSRVQPDRLDDLVADRVDRAERGHRLLEDRGDLAAADRAHRRGRSGRARRGRPAAPSASRRSRISPPTMRPGLLDDPQDRARGDALAAAALADDAERLAGMERRSSTPSTARTMPSSWQEVGLRGSRTESSGRRRRRHQRLSHTDRPRRAGRRPGS